MMSGWQFSSGEVPEVSPQAGDGMEVEDLEDEEAKTEADEGDGGTEQTEEAESEK